MVRCRTRLLPSSSKEGPDGMDAPRRHQRARVGVSDIPPCWRASPVVAASSRRGLGRSPPWCSRDGGCVWHPQGQPSRTGSRPNDALHRACPVPRSPPEAAKSARDMRSLAHKRKMWVTVSSLMRKLDDLTKNELWRRAVGIRRDSRMKGAELILRFMAFRYDRASYAKP